MEDEPFIVRIGMFFLVLGGWAFILFVASDLSDKTDFDYFFVAVVLLFIGWRLRGKRPAPPPSTRFAFVKKWNEDRKKKKAEKAQKKQDSKKKK